MLQAGSPSSSSSADGGGAGLPTPAGNVEVPPAPEGLPTPADEVRPAPDEDEAPFNACKRSRYDKTMSVKFEISDRKCIRGGFLLKECILDTTIFGATKMMKLGAREDWLCSAATGKTERRGPFEKGVAVVKTHIVEAIVTAAHASRDEKVKAAAAGRNCLDLGEESDSSSSSAESNQGKQAKVVNLLDGTPLLVKYRRLQFEAVQVGRVVHVEARADVAKGIVSACLEATLKVIQEETRLELEGPPPAPLLDTAPEEDAPDGSKEPDQSRVANLKGKLIRFDAKRSCYEILYVVEKDGKFKETRGVKGLSVRTKTKALVPLPQDQCDENMERAFEKAKMLWNALDQSPRPRYKFE